MTIPNLLAAERLVLEVAHVILLVNRTIHKSYSFVYDELTGNMCPLEVLGGVLFLESCEFLGKILCIQ